MRVLQITPGTGNFHCGSCLRDNALVAALRRMGHDVIMTPLYLPFVTDEVDSHHAQPLFFSGISVYLEQKSALFRHAPQWVHSLISRPALLRKAAAMSGMTSAEDLGELTVSMLRGEEGKQSRELDRLIAWMSSQPQFDVVCLSNVLLVGLARRLARELHLPVVCTLQGEDSFLDSLPPAQRQMAWATLAAR